MYLAYGKEVSQLGAIYSMLTAFRFLPAGTHGYRYLVYTDKPETFDGLGVEIRTVSAGELEDWMGGTTYKHRRKTAAIIDALERFPGPIVFIDTDTYFKRSPVLLFDRIGNGKTLFHTKEARLFETGDPENEKLKTGLRHSKITDGSGKIIPFSDRSDMWNTGVLGLTPENLPAVKAALPIMEQLWAASGSAPVEQFAVGHMLADTRRMTSLDVVFHYWCGDMRVDFERSLPKVIAELKALPASERPTAALQYRPRWPLPTVVRSKVREFTRSIGIPTNGVIKSV